MVKNFFGALILVCSIANHDISAAVSDIFQVATDNSSLEVHADFYEDSESFHPGNLDHLKNLKFSEIYINSRDISLAAIGAKALFGLQAPKELIIQLRSDEPSDSLLVNNEIQNFFLVLYKLKINWKKTKFIIRSNIYELEFFR